MKTLQDSSGFHGKMKIETFKGGVKLRETDWMENKIVSSDTHGRNLIIRKLANNNVYGIAIDSAEIGTGSTAPADSDTALQTPVVTGVDIANAVITAHNVLTLSIFMSDTTLADGTYAEFALRIGTKLFSRILISPTYSKSTGEDSIFTYVITLT